MAVRVLLVVTGLLWFSAEVRRSFHRRHDATTADRGSRILVQLAAVTGAAAAVVVTRLTPGRVLAETSPVAAWAGLGVLWCGVALRLWCFQTLGRYFTFTVATSEAQPVISAGPYRVLRHPSYTATLLVLLGLGTFFANAWGIVVLLAVVLAGLAYRIQVEERALTAAMGDRYRQFAATRKRIIPYVW